MFYKKKDNFLSQLFIVLLWKKTTYEIFLGRVKNAKPLASRTIVLLIYRGVERKVEVPGKLMSQPLLPTLPIFEASVSLSNRYEDWQCIILYPILHRSPS